MAPRTFTWGLAAVAAVAVLAHVQVVAAGFVYDDAFAVVGNPILGHLGSLFSSDFWGRAPGDPTGVGTFRPLPVLSFWLDWHAGGGSAWIFHLHNLLWHALAACLLAVCVRRRAGERTALVCGVIFAALAVNSEAVASIVGRADLMAAALALACWALVDRPVLCAAAFLGALLSKESAVILPAWLLLVEPAARRRHVLLALAAAIAAYGALRVAGYGLDAGAVLRSVNNNPLVAEPLGVRALTALRLFAMTLEKIAVPLRLSADYAFAEVLPDRGLTAVGAAGLGALAAALAGAVALRRRAPTVAAGLALLLVTWLFASNVFFTLPTLFAERLLYLPAAGVAVAAGAGLARLAARRPNLALAVTVLIVGGNLVRGALRDRAWHDDLALFSSAVEVTPGSARAWLNHGHALRARGRLDEALASYARAREIAPRWAAPRLGAGLALDAQGRLDPAFSELGAAAALDRDDPDAIYDLALFLARHGHAPQAAQVLRPYVERHPMDMRARALLADVNR